MLRRAARCASGAAVARWGRHQRRGQDVVAGRGAAEGAAGAGTKGRGFFLSVPAVPATGHAPPLLPLRGVPLARLLTIPRPRAQDHRRSRASAGRGAAFGARGSGPTSPTTGSVTVFRSPSNNSNGNTLTIIADSYDGKRLNSLNDIVPHPDGSYWFTDPLSCAKIGSVYLSAWLSGCSSATTLLMKRLACGGQECSTRPDMLGQSRGHSRGSLECVFRYCSSCGLCNWFHAKESVFE
jgi:hypothetical protein